MRALIFSCYLLLGLNLCAASVYDSELEREILLIRSFYNSYITASCKLPEDINSLEIVKNRFLTKRLLKELNSSELDYDPFLDAQDCQEDWLKTLKVIPDDDIKDNYIACYKFQNRLRCVRLILSTKTKNYQIDNVKYIKVIPSE